MHQTQEFNIGDEVRLARYFGPITTGTIAVIDRQHKVLWVDDGTPGNDYITCFMDRATLVNASQLPSEESQGADDEQQP